MCKKRWLIYIWKIKQGVYDVSSKKDSAEKLMMVSKYSDLADPTLADNWVVWHEGQQLRVTFRACAVEKV